ncbi:iron transporter [Devosia sp.]|uniref:iron transporter n=1 Tax=Devosia sp. TaxID=1871048 RepID=UPI003A8FF65C
MADHTQERPSDEADIKQLQMAKDEGAAYQRSLSYMVEQVADNGAKTTEGDYLIGIAQERAEGMYHLEGGELVWREPDEENCHLEVSVADAGDHRFIPALDITATMTSPDGEEIGPVTVPFLWHPGLYHYGINLKVPGDGRYTVRVKIAPPSFMRHDKKNGKRFADPVEVEFTDFEITTGQE